MLDVLNSKGFLPPAFLKYYVNQIRDHRGFLTTFPGHLNTYQNYLFNISSVIDNRAIDDALQRFGADLNANDDLANGTIYNFFMEKLIKSQESYPKDALAIELIFKVLHEIEGKELDAIAGLIAYPQDIESLISFTGTYELFLKILKESNGHGRFWEKPGIIALKQLMRQENLRALTDLTSGFNYSEVQKAIKVLFNSIVEVGTPSETVEILKVVRNFLTDQFLSYHTEREEGMVFIFERLIRNIYGEIYENLSVEELNKLLDVIVGNEADKANGEKKFIDFSGNEAQSVITDMDNLNLFTLKYTHKLLGIYQGHFKRPVKDKKSDEDYFYKLVDSLITPFKMADSIKGARVLAEILEDENLGTWDNLLNPLLFEKDNQKLMLDVLGSLNKVSLDSLNKAVIESNVVIPSTHHSLKFLRDNLIWEVNASEDIKDAIDSFFRISEPESAIWEGNYVLLRHWVTQAENIRE